MLTYIFRRSIGSIPVLLLIALFAFAVMRFAPGDPAMLIAGPDASPEMIQSIRDDLGLNQPFVPQFLTWSASVLQGDLGSSLFTRQPVVEMIAQRITPTVILMVLTVFISVVFGILSGIYAGWWHNKFPDLFIMLVAVILFSIPSFVVGYVLIYGLGLKLQWLPVQGYVPPADGVLASIQSLLLPALSLAGVYVAVVSRITRASMLENMRQDFVRTARAKGVGERTILFRHVLKNAAIPIATVVGSGIGMLLSGSVIIENVFAIPGLGRLTVDAVLRQDYPVIQAVILLFGVMYVGINLLIDLSYTFFDPRIRY